MRCDPSYTREPTKRRNVGVNLMTCLLILGMMSLTGCATNTRGLLDTPGSINCVGWRKIPTSPKDKFTRKTLERIVGHNEYGERLGCWKPKSKPKPSTN